MTVEKVKWGWGGEGEYTLWGDGRGYREGIYYPPPRLSGLGCALLR